MRQLVDTVFHQLDIAIRSIHHMMDQLPEEDLAKQPIPDKRSIQEMLSHLALICKADWLIMNEATQVQMDEFYRLHTPNTLEEMKQALTAHHAALIQAFSGFTLEQLLETKTSYWGVTYTRYEWLLEVLCHVVHHRGQLYTLLCEHVKTPKVVLFE